jgi:ferrous iron transport protein A
MKKHLSRCEPPSGPLTLTSARCGNPLRVLQIASSSPHLQRLKELGLGESAEIQKLVDGSALICSIQGTRLAIGRALGSSILVEEVGR